MTFYMTIEYMVVTPSSHLGVSLVKCQLRVNKWIKKLAKHNCTYKRPLEECWSTSYQSHLVSSLPQVLLGVTKLCHMDDFEIW